MVSGRAATPHQSIVLLGGGGHATLVVEIIRRGEAYDLLGYTAPEPGGPVERAGIPYLGTDDVLPDIRERGVRFAALGLGGTGDNRPRKSLFERARAFGFSFPPLVHPSAVVAAGVELPEGTLVGPGAVINPRVELGVNVIVNTRAVLEHGGRVGSHAHIAPGAVLCGEVEVGELAHVGASAVVIQGLKIGASAVVGAGAVVVRDVEPGTVVVGNPARVVQRVRPAGEGGRC